MITIEDLPARIRLHSSPETAPLSADDLDELFSGLPTLDEIERHTSSTSSTRPATTANAHGRAIRDRVHASHSLTGVVVGAARRGRPIADVSSFRRARD